MPDNLLKTLSIQFPPHLNQPFWLYTVNAGFRNNLLKTLSLQFPPRLNQTFRNLLYTVNTVFQDNLLKTLSIQFLAHLNQTFWHLLYTVNVDLKNNLLKYWVAIYDNKIIYNYNFFKGSLKKFKGNNLETKRNIIESIWNWRL